ncbi:MAG: ABC transporter ATP-binding protein [Pseudomonadota bacterium]
MAEPLLQIDDLVIEGASRGTRGEKVWTTLVDRVSLRLDRGEVLGLIGESGAGKSTLGLAALGYVRAGCRIASGRVALDGQDLVNLSETKRRALRGTRLAYVAQSAAASFNPAHRLDDQVTEAAVVNSQASQSAAREAASALYERLQLPDPARIGQRYPHQVSGGQLQRAMTAMAMVSGPDLIVFDEPTTALDVTTQIEVLAAIRDAVRQTGTAAIYITHDLAVVAQMADRIKVLLRGREVEEAETGQMLTNPREEYTKSLWAVRSFSRPAQAADTAPPQPALEMTDITAAYGTVRVLEDVSIRLHPRRTVAIVGESGSGKSTAARVMTGLLVPQKGDVRMGGEVLSPSYRDRDRKTLRRLQMIYQMADTALNPKTRVRDLIARPASLYTGLKGRALEDRVRDLMTMIELDPDTYLDRLPGALSGGQKQRIGIARAIAAEPEVVICDEVTSALDQIVAEGVLKLLDRLQRELGLAYMFITHDFATVKAVADDVVVMHRGRVVESDAADRVLNHPREDYTRHLLASVPEMDPGWLNAVLGERGEQQDGQSGG